MEEKVAIWMGTFDNEEDFSNYVFIDYTDDGDSIYSEFEREFGLKYYDRDMVERDFRNNSSNLAELLSGFSYSESFKLDNIRIEKSYNSVLLIYDYEKPIVKELIQENTKMDFIGQIDYVKIVDVSRWLVK
jgi:hypothetical protein